MVRVWAYCLDCEGDWIRKRDFGLTKIHVSAIRCGNFGICFYESFNMTNDGVLSIFLGFFNGFTKVRNTKRRDIGNIVFPFPLDENLVLKQCCLHTKVLYHEEERYFCGIMGEWERRR